jgi:pyruvate dehydrogenase kinase 2/3/4
VTADFVGEVFLKCNARDMVQRCGKLTRALMQTSTGSDRIPEVLVQGHLEATFPYIESHLEYIIGELLRNSIQAVLEKFEGSSEQPPPIEVLICETPQHVIMRISDQGGGIPREILPYLWSFSKGPRVQSRLKNLGQMPLIDATMRGLVVPSVNNADAKKWLPGESSLASWSSRPLDLRLGMGLPMSRVYAEYWAGSLELHSLEGYGVDAFLQISKLGNKNEQVTTRAAIDAV